MEKKHVAQSKTVWVAVIVSVLAMLWQGLDETVSTEIALIVQSVVFLVLRLFTNSAVRL